MEARVRGRQAVVRTRASLIVHHPRSGGLLLAVAALAFAACGNPQSPNNASPTAESSTPEPTATASAVATPVTPPTSTATLEPDASATPATPSPAPRATPVPSPTSEPFTGPFRVTEDFITLPTPPWYNPVAPGTSATASNGILTLDAPAEANEYALQEASYVNHQVPPADVWDRAVSNSRGWWVEVRMRVDPLVDDQCGSDAARGPSLTLWATDDTQKLVRLGFSRSCVALVIGFNEAIIVPMDTTSAFHVYRISTRLAHVDIYVDGVRVIQHDYPAADETGRGLVFGDGQSGPGATRSYWDYITYDVSGPSP